MKANLSLGGLVNLTALNKALKKADVLLWGRLYSGVDSCAYDYVSDGKFAAKVLIPTGSSALATLAGTFGTIPHDKVLLWTRGRGVSESRLDFEKVLDPERNAVIFDTTLTAHTEYDDLRIYRGRTRYITVSTLYADMIADATGIWSEDNSPRDGLLFQRVNEKAFILPVKACQSEPFARYLSENI